MADKVKIGFSTNLHYVCMEKKLWAIEINSNGIDILFHAFTTRDGLEQLVNCFIEALGVIGN